MIPHCPRHCQCCIVTIAGEPPAPVIVTFQPAPSTRLHRSLKRDDATSPVIVIFLQPPPRGCTRAIRRAERRLCEGLLPRLAEIQSNPEQLAPPRMQPRSAYSGSGRGSGGMRFSHPPSGFAPLSPSKAAPRSKDKPLSTYPLSGTPRNRQTANPPHTNAFTYRPPTLTSPSPDAMMTYESNPERRHTGCAQ